MTQISAPWDGTTVGHASLAPYDAATEWANIQLGLMGLFSANSNYGGVLLNTTGNRLGVSSGGTSPILVEPGYAFCAGQYYNNTDTVDFAIATPAAGERRDRVVLRKSWNVGSVLVGERQTVQLVVITGTPAAAPSTTPALVQTWGVRWDIPLATIRINAAGNITITDNRQFILGHNKIVVAGRRTGALDLVIFDVITWDTEHIDTHGIFTPPSMVCFTAPIRGLYRLSVGASFQVSGGNTLTSNSIRIIKNAGTFTEQVSNYNADIADANVARPNAVSQIFKLEAGDYLQAQFLGSYSGMSGVSVYTTDGATHFSAEYVGSIP